jgi:transcriptional regulator with XRE-family HTH domain
MNLEQVMKRFGKNLSRLRQERGFTQEQMREKGFNYRYYQKMEAGQVNPTLGTLLKLSNTLKCSMSDLLE